MTDDPKTTFEFDPLPGDTRTDQGEANVVAPKKRGRKPKPQKKERKKRGPRRVQMAAPGSIVELPPNTIIAEQPVKTRKPRRQAELNPEWDIIRTFMDLPNATRNKVLAALKAIFG